MKIAVTGGTGLVGQRLIPALTAAGHSVVLLTRRPEAQRSLPPGVTAAHFDAAVPLPAQTLQGADAVVHLAGENIAARRWTPERKAQIRDSRIKGTENVARAVVQAGTVRHLLSASAVGYYGDRGEEVLTEQSAPGEDFLARLCRDWEAAARPASEAGVRTVLLRIGQVLDAHSGMLGKMLPIFRAGLGGRLGHGRQYVSWIHIDDLVSLILWALATPSLQGPLNGTAPNPVTNRELTRALGAVLRRPTVLAVPRFALGVAIGDLAEGALASQRVVPARAKEAGFRHAHPELEPALAQLLRRG